jgi:hypothetical protein
MMDATVGLAFLLCFLRYPQAARCLLYLIPHLLRGPLRCRSAAYSSSPRFVYLPVDLPRSPLLLRSSATSPHLVASLLT